MAGFHRLQCAALGKLLPPPAFPSLPVQTSHLPSLLAHAILPPVMPTHHGHAARQHPCGA